MFRDPATDRLQYRAHNGLVFWMDYQDKGAPYQAPTIRTEDPQVSIVFVPGAHRGDQVFLMRHYGHQIPFSRPDASTLLDGPEFNELKDRNPGFDMVISAIGTPVQWVEYSGRDIRIHDIPVQSHFQSRAEQNAVCDLFCDMMGWVALYGSIAMLRGIANAKGDPVRKGRVGFDGPLQKALDRGDFIDRASDRRH